jgi:hypothetical protein
MAGSYLNDGDAQKWALLIGINEYPKLAAQYHLHGCLNDVAAIEQLLTSSQFLFPRENIVRLTSPAGDSAQLATRANILAAFESHLTGNHRIRNGDVVVIYYSGHGSQIPDEEGDEEDGYDETIVPCDSGNRTSRKEVLDISDDEIAIMLEQLGQRTQNINLIFDSCHSGTVTRALMDAEGDDALGKERYLPPASYPIARPLRTNVTRSMGPSDWMPLSKGYVLLAACMAHERAREDKFNFWARKSHGVMTYYLLEAMKDVGPDTTYYDIWDQLRIKVTKHNRWQNPQIEGAFERRVFGGAASPRKRYVEVSSVSQSGVVIAAGLASGVTLGSKFAVFRTGTNVFDDPSERIAEIGLIQVDAFNSLGRLESGLLEDIQSGCPAIEIEHNYGDQQMPVRVIGHNSQLGELRRQIKTSNLLKLQDDENEQPITTVRLRYRLDDSGNEITADGERLFILSAGDGHPLVEAIALNEESGTAVRQKLESIASFYNVLAIYNPDPESQLKGKLKLRLLKVVGNSNSTSPELLLVERNTGGDLNLKVGEKIVLEVENESDQKLHLVILSCDSSWGITPIFPESGAHDTGVAPRATRRTNRFTVELHEHQKPVKPTQPLPREVIKVIATTERVEFRALWQSSVRSVDQKPASLEVLMDTAMGMRNQPATRSLIKDPDQEVTDWTTTELVIHITT